MSLQDRDAEAERGGGRHGNDCHRGHDPYRREAVVPSVNRATSAQGPDHGGSSEVALGDAGSRTSVTCAWTVTLGKNLAKPGGERRARTVAVTSVLVVTTVS